MNKQKENNEKCVHQILTLRKLMQLCTNLCLFGLWPKFSLFLRWCLKSCKYSEYLAPCDFTALVKLSRWMVVHGCRINNKFGPLLWLNLFLPVKTFGHNVGFQFLSKCKCERNPSSVKEEFSQAYEIRIQTLTSTQLQKYVNIK